MTDKKQSCGTCQHFTRNPQQLDQGECRHSPPCATTHMVRNQMGGGQQITFTTYPKVAANDRGCYQFAPKLEMIGDTDEYDG